MPNISNRCAKGLQLNHSAVIFWYQSTFSPPNEQTHAVLYSLIDWLIWKHKVAEAGEKYSLFSVFGAAIEWVIVSDCGSHSRADWWVLQHWHRGGVRQDGNSFVRPSWKLKHPQCFILSGEHGFELVIFYCLVHRTHRPIFGRFLRSPKPVL